MAAGRCVAYRRTLPQETELKAVQDTMGKSIEDRAAEIEELQKQIAGFTEQAEQLEYEKTLAQQMGGGEGGSGEVCLGRPGEAEGSSSKACPYSCFFSFAPQQTEQCQHTNVPLCQCPIEHCAPLSTPRATPGFRLNGLGAMKHRNGCIIRTALPTDSVPESSSGTL